MNISTKSPVQAPSETTALQPALPVPLPLREIEEVVKAIHADCLVAPDEYVEEARVPFGGE